MRLFLAILVLGLALGLVGKEALAQEADDHQVTIEVEEMNDMETGDPPPPVSIPSGGDGTVTSALTVRTNAPPSNPRTVEADLAESLPEGFTLEVDVTDDATVDGHIELGTEPQAVMEDVHSVDKEYTLEYKASATPKVKTTETTATVTYTVKKQ